MILSDAQKVALRATVNEWVGRSFPAHRSLLAHNLPVYDRGCDAWSVELVTKRNGSEPRVLGTLVVSTAGAILEAPAAADVLSQLDAVAQPAAEGPSGTCAGAGWELRLGDGIAAAAEMPDRSVGLLLTDPPYGISRRYTCETQIPRRLRRDGSDFIMPRGHFGDWDAAVDPQTWTSAVLPKVAGWAVTFCAQSQIGDYCDILDDHGFVAVGPMVWQNTNPVPFNHRHKPINAWEAMVVGKRPGTPFNGDCVHNVFVHKSPSPQQRIHPTQKPLPLIAEFVELFSSRGDTVLDPFAGSGTTIVAARQHGRRAVGYELDPAIHRRAADRLTASLL